MDGKTLRFTVIMVYHFVMSSPELSVLLRTVNGSERSQLLAVCSRAQQLSMSMSETFQFVNSTGRFGVSRNAFAAYWRLASQHHPAPAAARLQAARRLVYHVLTTTPSPSSSTTTSSFNNLHRPAGAKTLTAVVGLAILDSPEHWQTTLVARTAYAARLGVARATAGRHLAQACALGYLTERQRRPGGASVVALRRLPGRATWTPQMTALVDDLVAGNDTALTALWRSVAHAAWRYGEWPDASWLATVAAAMDVDPAAVGTPKRVRPVRAVLAATDASEVRAVLAAEAQRTGAGERQAAAIEAQRERAAERREMVSKERAARGTTFAEFKNLPPTPKPSSPRAKLDAWLDAVASMRPTDADRSAAETRKRLLRAQFGEQVVTAVESQVRAAWAV